MAELRYRAGKIRDPGVHKIGIIALGSHLENHGPALPIDTDAKIGAHIAFQSSLQTGAKFLGIIFPAYELDTIDHGVHVSLDTLKENVITTLNSAKKFLDIEKVVDLHTTHLLLRLRIIFFHFVFFLLGNVFTVSFFF